MKRTVNKPTVQPVEFIECSEPDCRATPNPDCAVPLCNPHIGQVYEFARDLINGSGLTDDLQAEEVTSPGELRRLGLIVGDPIDTRIAAAFRGMTMSIADKRAAMAKAWGIRVTDADRRAIADHAADEYRTRDAAVCQIKATDNPGPGELVYYVRFGDRVKIGYTSNLANRMQAIPHDEILATESGTFAVEKARHIQFAELRITGEWFQYVEPLTEHIEGLRRAVA